MMSIRIGTFVLLAFAAGVNAFALKEYDEYALHGGKVTIDALPTRFGAEAARLECGAPENFLSGTFTGWDYSVVLGMLIISIGIGIFYGFFDKASDNSEDFLRGSGMKLFPVSLSLTTSFITAIELLGNPAEMFFNGTQYSLIGKSRKQDIQDDGFHIIIISAFCSSINGSRYSAGHEGLLSDLLQTRSHQLLRIFGHPFWKWHSGVWCNSLHCSDVLLYGGFGVRTCDCPVEGDQSGQASGCRADLRGRCLLCIAGRYESGCDCGHISDVRAGVVVDRNRGAGLLLYGYI